MRLGSTGSWEPVGAPGISQGAFTASELCAALDCTEGPATPKCPCSKPPLLCCRRRLYTAGSAQHVSLACDPSGAPLLAFQDSGRGMAAVVLRFSGGAWAPLGGESLSDGGAAFPRLALDLRGTLFAVYQVGCSAGALGAMCAARA